MKAVILAAGKSTRTHPLTITRPKPLLKVANKTLLEHNLEELQGIVDEAILIVGFMKEKIMERFGKEYKGIKLTYIEQKEQLGTGHALSLAKGIVGGKMIVMNSDDLYHASDIKRCLEHDSAVLVKKVKDPSRFGVIIQENGIMKDIIEKPPEFVSDLANTGLYVLSENIFDISIQKSERGEYELIDIIRKLAKDSQVKVVNVERYWLSVGYPWDLLTINSYFVKEIEKPDIKGEIEDNVTIKGNIIVGKGTKILSGTYIEGNVIIGENCKIGPMAYLREGTTIGDNCHIGASVEIKNTIVMDKSNVPHLSYIGDSVIGENCNLGAGSITGNLRHDNNNIRSMAKGKLVDTGRRKLGVILGDDVHTGINTCFYPGRKMWPGTITRPGENVTKDIVD